MLIEGMIVIDESKKHYNVQYGASNNLYKLRSGMPLDVLIGDKWVSTYILKDEEKNVWYLEKIDKATKLDGMKCQITV